MVWSQFREDLENIDAILEEIPYDTLLPVIPDFYPIPRLIRYQDIRCNAGEYEDLLAAVLAMVQNSRQK